MCYAFQIGYRYIFNSIMLTQILLQMQCAFIEPDFFSEMRGLGGFKADKRVL